MLTLVQEAGFPVFFLLAFGLATLVWAAGFARSPTRRGFRCTLALSTATLFTVLTTICVAMATVGHRLPAYLAAHPAEPIAHVLMQGLAESLSAGILGFTMLSLTALLVMVGCYREST